MDKKERTRLDDVKDAVWNQQNFRTGDMIDRKFVDAIVEHVYQTALADAVVMLEDCSGFDLVSMVRR